MRSSRFSSSHVPVDDVQQVVLPAWTGAKYPEGYQWTVLSVTTVGVLLASIQGSALLIALPK